MKILFLSENYFPNVSGVPVVVKYLAEGLLTLGHSVSVATQEYEDCLLLENINGVDVYRFRIHSNLFHHYKGDTGSYIKFVKSFGADVIIIELAQCITTDLALPILKDLSGKIIFHSHGLAGLEIPFFAIQSDIKHTLGTTYNWINSQIYYHLTFRKACKYFATTLCLSEIDNSLPYFMKNAKDTRILDNAADNMFFDEEYCSHDVLYKYVKLENNRYMMSCANYLYIKDQISMINQYYLSESSKSYSLVCIGMQANDYYRECMEVVEMNEKKYGHRDVHLLYGVSRNDIPCILNKASLYLVTSRVERYSISLIETMSQGVPFISTNVGNARLLPGGRTVDDVSELGATIDCLLNDKVAYREYSIKGKEFAYNNCRVDVAVNRLNNIITSI